MEGITCCTRGIEPRDDSPEAPAQRNPYRAQVRLRLVLARRVPQLLVGAFVALALWVGPPNAPASARRVSVRPLRAPLQIRLMGQKRLVVLAPALRRAL